MPLFAGVPFIVTKYTRITHYPDGSCRSFTSAQEKLWRDTWPIGCSVPANDYKSLEEIKARVDYFYKSYRLQVSPHPTKLQEVLDELEKAKLIATRLFGGKE